jgi:hypothetical protein
MQVIKNRGIVKNPRKGMINRLINKCQFFLQTVKTPGNKLLSWLRAHSSSKYVYY